MDNIPQVESAEPDTTKTKKQRTLFGHPWVLSNIVALESWERFSFYGMQALLALYIFTTVGKGGLGLSPSVALSIVGAYTGTVYFSTVLGGWVADRLLGSERTLLYSAVLIMFGHAALALVPGIPGLAIGCVAVAFGAGGVKTSSTSIIGHLYADGDARKDAGFSIFFAGINIGLIIGPLITGLLQSRIGFHWGFGAAAVGMLLGLSYYLAGRNKMPDTSRVVRHPAGRSVQTRAVTGAVIVIAAIAIAFATGVLNGGNLSLVVTILVAIVVVISFSTMISSNRISGDEREKLLAFIPVFIANLALFAFGAINVFVVFTKFALDTSILGFDVPIPWLSSANGVAEVVVSALVAVAIGARRRIPIPTHLRGPIGALLCALSSAAMLLFAGAEPHTYNVLILLPSILLFSLAEYLVYPLGLSASTKLAPSIFYAQMVALFYLSISLGGAAAGALSAGLFTIDGAFGYWLILAIASGAIAVVLFALSPWTKRMLREIF